MSKKNVVKVTIVGEEYTLRSEASPEQPFIQRDRPFHSVDTSDAIDPGAGDGFDFVYLGNTGICDIDTVDIVCIL